jgi:hypothetical protein
MTTPWTFGWTQLLTFAGLVLTGYIGYQGLRTFDRWRREKIEGKRIDVALDALSTAYKSKYVFEYIRSPLVRSHEFADMPGRDDGKEKRKQGEAPYAILKRIEANKDFFDHVWELQPKFMAVFGKETEEIFMLLHTARRDIEIACEMLMWDVPQPNAHERDSEEAKLYVQLRRDISSSSGATAKDGDAVGTKLEKFRERIEALCRPAVDSEFRRPTA